MDLKLVGMLAAVLIESSGPTALSIAAVTDGQYLKRSGSTIVGDTPAGAGDIALSKNAPTTTTTITAGYSGMVLGKYTIAAGTKLSIGAGARFRIL